MLLLLFGLHRFILNSDSIFNIPLINSNAGRLMTYFERIFTSQFKWFSRAKKTVKMFNHQSICDLFQKEKSYIPMCILGFEMQIFVANSFSFDLYINNGMLIPQRAPFKQKHSNDIYEFMCVCKQEISSERKISLIYILSYFLLHTHTTCSIMELNRFQTDSM